MNINKHAIILPALITSAVSLHILSYYLEEPEEIVYNNPIQTVAPTQTSTNPTPVSIPTNQVSNTPVKESNKPVTENKPNNVQETKTPEPLKTPEITETVNNESPQVTKDEIIKSKDFKEIIREARINSGRIDPFLSVKPPKMEIIPEIPQELVNEKRTLLAMKIEKEREQIRENRIVSSKKQQNTSLKTKNKPTLSNRNNKVKPPIQIPKTDTGKKIIVNNKNQQDEILVAEAIRLSEGIKLTGIVTGTKPLAILSVNDESKVLGIGDELVNNGDRIRVVSIDFNRKSILITDGYYKARLLIEEE